MNFNYTNNELIFSIYITIRKFKLNSAFVGLKYEHKDNHFVWLKKNFEGAGYKKWCGNKPNNKNPRKNCVELRTQYHCLNDVQCYSERPFICEINDSKKNVIYFGH